MSNNRGDKRGSRPFQIECLESRLVMAAVGLVGHWNFDEGPDWHDDPFQATAQAVVAADSVGENHATLMNMSAANWGSGRQFTALDFDGQNDFLSTADPLSDTLSGSASLSFWLKTTQQGNDDAALAPGIAGVEQVEGDNDVAWGWLDASGRIGISAGSGTAAKSQLPVNDGLWHHIVLTRDAASGSLQVFLDGDLQNSAVGEVGQKTTHFSSYGRIESSAGSSHYFQGRLDQIHLFDRVIEPATVTQLRDNHAPKGFDITTQVAGSTPTVIASVLLKSYDPEQDILSTGRHTAPEHGSVSDNSDGTFTYTANPGFVGVDSFQVLIHDGNGGYGNVNVRVMVTEATQSPVATSLTNYQSLQADGSDIFLSGPRVPRATDWDGDGDYDLLVGQGGSVWHFANVGTTTNPSFAAGVRVKAAGADIAVSTSSFIAFADMTGDGVEDLVVVDSSRRLRVYRNTAPAHTAPIYAAAAFVRDPLGNVFVLPDQRFDVADVNGDGIADIVMGAFGGEMRTYLNVGTASTAVFDANQYETLTTDFYNLYPRVTDFNNDGLLDLVRGKNFDGDVRFWVNPDFSQSLPDAGVSFKVSLANGSVADVRAGTDGPIVDIVDLNGDGVKDMIFGGHIGNKIFWATGVERTFQDIIDDIENIYDSHAANIGAALDANNNELLLVLKGYFSEIAGLMRVASAPAQEEMATQLKSHVAKYSFLSLGGPPLNTNVHHRMPGAAAQTFLFLHFLRPDTPQNRLDVADTFGLNGWKRSIYLDRGVLIGDNQRATQATLQGFHEFLIRQPYASFPDSIVTVDQFFGDEPSDPRSLTEVFTSAKNIFRNPVGQNLTEMSSEQRNIISGFTDGSTRFNGDYIMAVLGHEVNHSLDLYVNTRANRDLRRRWGQMLVYSAGPDIRAQNNPGDFNNGWYDQSATQAYWQSVGLWDGVESWNVAWNRYWTSGPGAAFENFSTGKNGARFNITVPHETLAGNANFYFDFAEGKLMVGVDRFRRALEGDESIAPFKATINEAVQFMDFVSIGLNKVVMPDTAGVNGTSDWSGSSFAYLERDDDGLITKIEIDSRTYEFTYDSTGRLTDIVKALDVRNDIARTTLGTAVTINPLQNDFNLLTNQPVASGIASFTQPRYGTVVQDGSSLIYTPSADFPGIDSFTYAPDVADAGQSATIEIIAGPPDHHWRLDEGAGVVAVDSSGDANGSLVNMNPAADWVAGRLGPGALDFDGANDRVRISGALGSVTSDFTVAAWIRPDDLNGIQRVLSREALSDGWGFGLTNSSLLFTTFGIQDFVIPANLQAGDWQHVAVAFSSGFDVTFYVNGARIGTVEGNAAARLSTGIFAIGFGPSNEGFDGQIDDVRFYKRTLVENEIAAIFAASQPTGDFDRDGRVGGADFLRWQRGYAKPNPVELTDGDGNADGTVNGLDLAIWQSDFGQAAVATSATSISSIKSPLADASLPASQDVTVRDQAFAEFTDPSLLLGSWSQPAQREAAPSRRRDPIAAIWHGAFENSHRDHFVEQEFGDQTVGVRARLPLRARELPESDKQRPEEK